LKANCALRFSAADDYKDDPANQTNAAGDRRESDSVTFLVRDFKRA
jgi:hypothetical protein